MCDINLYVYRVNICNTIYIYYNFTSYYNLGQYMYLYIYINLTPILCYYALRDCMLYLSLLYNVSQNLEITITLNVKRENLSINTYMRITYVS